MSFNEGRPSTVVVILSLIYPSVPFPHTHRRSHSAIHCRTVVVILSLIYPSVPFPHTHRRSHSAIHCRTVVVILCSSTHQCPSPTHTGGATLLFTVELIELQKKPFFKLPTSQFWYYLGIVGVIILLVYEVYKRGGKKEEKATSAPPSKKKGSKKKNY